MSGPDRGTLIANIRVRDGRRAVDPAKAAALAESIKEIGLLSPIIVDWAEAEEQGGTEQCDLVAGLHRLEACRSLGWKCIPTISRASIAQHETTEETPVRSALLNQLTEIDENLCRAELSALERATATAKRKDVYEQLHPETKIGGAPGKAGGGKVAKVATVASFVADTAKKTGRSKRSVARDAQIGSGLTDEAAEALRGTPVENSPEALVKIAQEKDPAKQVTLADEKVRLRLVKPPKKGAADRMFIRQKPDAKRHQDALLAIGAMSGYGPRKRIARELQKRWPGSFGAWVDTTHGDETEQHVAERMGINVLDVQLGKLVQHYAPEAVADIKGGRSTLVDALRAALEGSVRIADLDRLRAQREADPGFAALRDMDRLLLGTPGFGSRAARMRDFLFDGGELALVRLGLDWTVNAASLNAAYKRAAAVAHPDRGGSHEAILALNLARDLVKRIVTDPAKESN